MPTTQSTESVSAGWWIAAGAVLVKVLHAIWQLLSFSDKRAKRLRDELRRDIDGLRRDIADLRVANSVLAQTNLRQQVEIDGLRKEVDAQRTAKHQAIDQLQALTLKYDELREQMRQKPPTIQT